MTTTTLPSSPSRVELELMLRAAVLQASPQEHGREQAERATGSLVAVLAAVAAALCLFDIALLMAIG